MPKVRKGITKKQRDFARLYAESENGTQSALKVYNVKNKNVAHSIASENLQKPTVIAEILEAKKTIAEQIPDELLVKRHKELLNKTDDKGKIETQAVSKGLEMAYKIKKIYSDEVDREKVGTTYNFYFRPEVQKEVKLLEDKIKNMISDSVKDQS